MDKLVKKHMNIITEFVNGAHDLLLEIEKTREKDQIPVGDFLTSLNECVANASNLYYSVKLMKYLDEAPDKTEQKIPPDNVATAEMQPYAV